MSLHLNYAIYWLVFLSLIEGIRGQVQPKLHLVGQSYQLNYRVMHENAAYEVVELHSAWQSRSKVHYKLHGFGERMQSSKSFYSDEKHVLAVEFDATICHQVPPAAVNQILYDFPQNVLEDFGDSHLIGAGRLLSFVEANLAKFSLVNTDANELGQYVKFFARFGPKSEEILIHLVYNRDQSQNLPNGIPLIMIVTFERYKKHATFRFTRYQALNNRFQSSTSSVPSANQYADYETNSASYDLFFIDRAIGCSKTLDFESFAGESTQLIEYNSKRFSFSSRPPVANGLKSIDMTVIYEPSLSTLRINQELADTSIQSIVNFYADRKFHILEERNGDELKSGSSIKLKPRRSCVVSRVKHDYQSDQNRSGNPFTLGQTLLGIEHLVYLGLARVRGIEAKVYEAHNCDWPIWLQQPLLYEQSNDEQVTKGNGSQSQQVTLKWYDESNLMDKEHISMTNVFYFANSQQFDLLESKLLLVELFLRDEKSGQIIKRSTFPIYDFSWDLTSTNPIGQRYESSFSLQDHCLASMDESDFAFVRILFEARASSDKLEWLQDGTKRNLALLRVAQKNLHLSPVSIMYDIESSLTIGNEIPNPNRPESDREVSIAVNMRAAERTKSLARTVFICMANPKTKHFESLRTNNFQSCHYNAAHRKVDTLMAFNVRTSECLIMKTNVVQENVLNKLIDKVCKFGQTSGSFVVYQILHQDKWDEVRSVQEARDWIGFKDEIDMLNPMKIHQDDLGIKLRLRSYDVSKLNDKLRYNLDEKHSGEDKKFTGFGLVPTEPQNKVVDLNLEQDNQRVGMMRFEDCQTACLADVECQSFSVCVTKGTMRCVLSTVSFSTPSMVLQLMVLNEAGYKFGENNKIRIDLEEQKSLTRNNATMSHGEYINVMRYPTCELHNKLYRDYFHQMPGWVKFCGSDVIFRPVAHLDQCAELCFKRTIDYMREMSQLDETLSSDVGSDQDQEAAQMKKACGVYYFISKQRLESEVSETLDKHLVEIGHQEFVNGFCVIDEKQSAELGKNEARVKHEMLRQITFDTHYFHYDSLYSKEFGISLANSKLTYDERKSIIREMKEAVSRGLAVKETRENLGRVEVCSHKYASVCVSDCAKECFNSRSGDYHLKCRSFDYVEIDHPDRETRRICAMNSITLKSTLTANRQDLIDRSPDVRKGVHIDQLNTVKVWHYEPRDGIVADSQKLELVDPFKWVSSSGLHLGGFVMFVMTVVLFSIGTIAGFVGGAKLFPGGQTGEIDRLVVNPGYISGSSAMDMNNIVDYK